MNVSIGERWEGFVAATVRSGRYASASEVVREGLRLVEERESRLAALKETIERALAEGDPGDDATLDAELATVAASLARTGA